MVMYENMNNKIARLIKITGNILGIVGVILGIITMVNEAEFVIDGEGGVLIFLNGLSVIFYYIVIMFVFWGLAEIIELLSVIKANTTNQVELSSQKNTSYYSHNNNNPDTDSSKGL